MNELQAPMSARTALVVCIGNRFRSDDAAGLEIAELVRAAGLAGIEVREMEGEPTSLIDAWEGVDSVYLVDAVSSGGLPGVLYRFDAAVEPPSAQFHHRGTHAFSIAEVIELARALDRLPPRLVVYGIEANSFSAGIGLSPEVEQGVRKAGVKLLEELAGEGVES